MGALLIHSLASLARVRDIARNIINDGSVSELTAARLMEAIREEMPDTEVASLEEVLNLLHVLAFKFGNLYSDHYYKIGQRADVVYHRSKFAPFLLSLYRSGEAWVVHADASFTYENAHSARAWFSLDEEYDNLINVRPGVGRRLNMWEFVTNDGILWHPDGT